MDSGPTGLVPVESGLTTTLPARDLPFPTGLVPVESGLTHAKVIGRTERRSPAEWGRNSVWMPVEPTPPVVKPSLHRDKPGGGTAVEASHR